MTEINNLLSELGTKTAELVNDLLTLSSNEAVQESLGVFRDNLINLQSLSVETLRSFPCLLMLATCSSQFVLLSQILDTFLESASLTEVTHVLELFDQERLMWLFLRAELKT